MYLTAHHAVITLRSMIRTQIQLSEAQAHRLHVVAKREHISVAEVVRRCIDSSLADSDIELNARYQQARRLVGRFRQSWCQRYLLSS